MSSLARLSPVPSRMPTHPRPLASLSRDGTKGRFLRHPRALKYRAHWSTTKNQSVLAPLLGQQDLPGQDAQASAAPQCWHHFGFMQRNDRWCGLPVGDGDAPARLATEMGDVPQRSMWLPPQLGNSSGPLRGRRSCLLVTRWANAYQHQSWRSLVAFDFSRYKPLPFLGYRLTKYIYLLLPNRANTCP